MVEQIFRSCINLKYKKSDIEEDFQKHKDGLIKDSIKLYTIILLICSFISSIVCSMYYTGFYQTMKFKGSTFSAYSTSVVYIFLFLVSRYSKKPKHLRWLNYLNYFFSFFVHINFRYPLIHFQKLSLVLYYTMLSFEMMVRLLWITTGILGFVESMVWNAFTTVALWGIYAPIGKDDGILENNMYLILGYSVLFFVHCAFAYFYEKKDRTSFYHSFFYERRMKWFNNTFENMNTGLLSLKGSNVTFVNNFLFYKLQMINSIKEKFLTATNARLQSEYNHNENSNLNIVLYSDDKAKFLSKISNFLVKELISNINTDILSKIIIKIRSQYFWNTKHF
jgi:hypothetical protein